MGVAASNGCQYPTDSSRSPIAVAPNSTPIALDPIALGCYYCGIYPWPVANYCTGPSSRCGIVATLCAQLRTIYSDRCRSCRATGPPTWKDADS